MDDDNILKHYIPNPKYGISLMVYLFVIVFSLVIGLLGFCLMFHAIFPKSTALSNPYASEINSK